MTEVDNFLGFITPMNGRQMGRLLTLILTDRLMEVFTSSLQRGSRRDLGSRLSSRGLGIGISELVDGCGCDLKSSVMRQSRTIASDREVAKVKITIYLCSHVIYRRYVDLLETKPTRVGSVSRALKLHLLCSARFGVPVIPRLQGVGRDLCGMEVRIYIIFSPLSLSFVAGRRSQGDGDSQERFQCSSRIYQQMLYHVFVFSVAPSSAKAASWSSRSAVEESIVIGLLLSTAHALCNRLCTMSQY